MGRGIHGLSQGIILAFTGKTWGKLRSILVNIA